MLSAMEITDVLSLILPCFKGPSNTPPNFPDPDHREGSIRFSEKTPDFSMVLGRVYPKGAGLCCSGHWW